MNIIQMAARIYDARDALKSLDGESYLEKEAPYIEAVRNVMAAKNVNSIQAAITVATRLQEKGFGGFTIIRALAASLEVRDK